MITVHIRICATVAPSWLLCALFAAARCGYGQGDGAQSQHIYIYVSTHHAAAHPTPTTTKAPAADEVHSSREEVNIVQIRVYTLKQYLQSKKEPHGEDHYTSTCETKLRLLRRITRLWPNARTKSIVSTPPPDTKRLQFGVASRLILGICGRNKNFDFRPE